MNKKITIIGIFIIVIFIIVLAAFIAGRVGELTIEPAAEPIVVAAFDSTPASKDQADFAADGVDDHVEIQAAIDALPTSGGKVVLSEGTFNFRATVSRAIDLVTIKGQGKSTILNFNGVTPLFNVGTQNAWTFIDFATDAGGIDRGNSTNTRFIRIWKTGVSLRDIETSPRMNLVYTSAPLGTLRNVIVDDDILFLLRERAQILRIMDVTDPANPLLISETNLGGRGCDIRKRGTLLYISIQEWGIPAPTWRNSIVIVDVSNLSSPTIVGRVQDHTKLRNAHGIFLDGNYLYVAAHMGDRFTIVDISDPTNPFIVYSLSDTRLDGAHDVHIDYPHAYVGVNHGGTGAHGTATEGALVIIDISDPENPAIVGLAESGEIQHLVKKGRYIFGATVDHGGIRRGGLYAFDVSNPSAPTIVSHIGGFGAYWLYLAEDYIFVAATGGFLDERGLVIIDVSNPASMKIVQWIPTPAERWGNIFVYGKHVFATNIEVGSLCIYEIE